MSWLLESNDDTGSPEEHTSLFEVVVRMIRVFVCGRRKKTWFLRSVAVVEPSMGIDRVDGRPRPGKEVSKTLMI